MIFHRRLTGATLNSHNRPRSAGYTLAKNDIPRTRQLRNLSQSSLRNDNAFYFRQVVPSELWPILGKREAVHADNLLAEARRQLGGLPVEPNSREGIRRTRLVSLTLVSPNSKISYMPLGCLKLACPGWIVAPPGCAWRSVRATCQRQSVGQSGCRAAGGSGRPGGGRAQSGRHQVR